MEQDTRASRVEREGREAALFPAPAPLIRVGRARLDELMAVGSAEDVVRSLAAASAPRKARVSWIELGHSARPGALAAALGAVAADRGLTSVRVVACSGRSCDLCPRSGAALDRLAADGRPVTELELGHDSRISPGAAGAWCSALERVALDGAVRASADAAAAIFRRPCPSLERVRVTGPQRACAELAVIADAMESGRMPRLRSLTVVAPILDVMVVLRLIGLAVERPGFSLALDVGHLSANEREEASAAMVASATPTSTVSLIGAAAR